MPLRRGGSLALALGVFGQWGEETRLAKPLLDRYVLIGRLERDVGQLIHVLDEQHVSPAEVQLIAGSKLPLSLDSLAVDTRTVEASKVANAPACPAIGCAHLRVLTAALIVLEHDAVGRRPANGVALPGRERENVPKAIVALDHQIGSCAGHG